MSVFVWSMLERSKSRRGLKKAMGDLTSALHQASRKTTAAQITPLPTAPPKKNEP